MNLYYDYLIFGSGIEATLFAYEKADRGRSVLLLYDKPYLGGSITESYHCIRQIPFTFYCNLVYEAFNSIRFEKNGLVHWEEDLFLVNPIAAKKALTEILHNSKAEYNLGVALKKILKEDNVFNIEYIANGQKKNIIAGKILDASTACKLIRQYKNNNYKSREAALNLFIEGENTKNCLAEIKPDIVIDLPHDSYFVSLNIPESENPDKEAKQTINKMDSILSRCKSKIISPPPEVFRKYSHEITVNEDNLKTVAEVVEDEYGEYDEFIITDKIISKISAF